MAHCLLCHFEEWAVLEVLLRNSDKITEARLAFYCLSALPHARHRWEPTPGTNGKLYIPAAQANGL